MSDNTALPPSDAGSTSRLVPAGTTVPASRSPYSTLGYGGYGGQGSDDQESLAGQVFKYWRMFEKRKWLVIGILLAFVTVGGLKTLMETPLYTASARLQIDRSAAKIVDTPTATQVDDQDFDFIKTQIELLKSRQMSERVASSLKLGNDAEFLKPRSFSIFGLVGGLLRSTKEGGETGDKRALESAAAGLIIGNIVIRPVPGARLVDVAYNDPVPARAQKIANAYAAAFIASEHRQAV